MYETIQNYLSKLPLSDEARPVVVPLILNHVSREGETRHQTFNRLVTPDVAFFIDVVSRAEYILDMTGDIFAAEFQTRAAQAAIHEYQDLGAIHGLTVTSDYKHMAAHHASLTTVDALRREKFVRTMLQTGRHAKQIQSAYAAVTGTYGMSTPEYEKVLYELPIKPEYTNRELNEFFAARIQNKESEE